MTEGRERGGENLQQYILKFHAVRPSLQLLQHEGEMEYTKLISISASRVQCF